MKNINKLYLLALVSVTALLFSILFSSASIAATQSASSLNTYAYIANQKDNSVSVINTTTYSVIDIVPAGLGPIGVAVSPQMEKRYMW